MSAANEEAIMSKRLLRCTCVWNMQQEGPDRVVADPFCPAAGRHGDER